jgi:hypothetical protein
MGFFDEGRKKRGELVWPKKLQLVIRSEKKSLAQAWNTTQQLNYQIAMLRQSLAMFVRHEPKGPSKSRVSSHLNNGFYIEQKAIARTRWEVQFV